MDCLIKVTTAKAQWSMLNVIIISEREKDEVKERERERERARVRVSQRGTSEIGREKEKERETLRHNEISCNVADQAALGAHTIKKCHQTKGIKG